MRSASVTSKLAIYFNSRDQLKMHYVIGTPTNDGLHAYNVDINGDIVLTRLKWPEYRIVLGMYLDNDNSMQFFEVDSEIENIKDSEPLKRSHAEFHDRYWVQFLIDNMEHIKCYPNQQV